MILVDSFRDSSAFLAILPYLCLMFGMVSGLMDLGSPGISLLEGVLMVFADSLGGLFIPLANPDDQAGGFNARLPDWTNFLFLQLLTSIVALNTLIAILGDSFDEVQNDLPKNDTLRSEVPLHYADRPTIPKNFEKQMNLES